MKYEDIKHLKISSLAEVDLKVWVMDEVTSLANDFGQNIDNDMLIHISSRLIGAFKTRYISWHVGTVHSAFQTGLAGNYGAFHKVTVKALFHFLNMAQKQLIEKSVVSAEEESDRKNAAFSPKESPVIDFLVWASANMICLEYLSPGYDALKKREVSKEVRAMAVEYHEAKEMNLLKSFKNRLKTEAEKYAEAS